MKNIAIVKIIIWSLVAITLTGLLITMATTGGLAGSNLFTFDLPGGNLETVRVQEFPAAEIENLDIRWTSGTFNILPTAGDKIIITEKATGDLAESELLQISEQNRTLVIEQGESRRRIFFFNFGWRNIENEIQLPEKEYNRLRTRMTSGKFNLTNLSFQTLDNEMTSGTMDFSAVKADDLTIDITSGKADITGTFAETDISLTSGSIDLDNTIAPANIRVNVVSGRVILSIPDNDGFIIGEKVTSGSFKTNFSVDEFNRYGDGTRSYSFKITSGLAELRKK